MLFRFDPFDQLHRSERTPGLLAMDAVRKDDTVFVYFDAPGVERDDIELTTEKNSITVETTRRWYDVESDTLVNERPQGTFRRHVQFGDEVDIDSIDAVLENGVLTLALPLKEDATARSIDIRTSSNSAEELEPASS
ncbi:MAG: Hsp20/alpha crystallin family protein [Acidimicrobiales bacterium]|nr:Hsp20/alpha crystallin family protein [Acidimicrobiales bacterium]